MKPMLSKIPGTARWAGTIEPYQPGDEVVTVWAGELRRLTVSSVAAVDNAWVVNTEEGALGIPAFYVAPAP